MNKDREILYFLNDSANRQVLKRFNHLVFDEPNSPVILLNTDVVSKFPEEAGVKIDDLVYWSLHHRLWPYMSGREAALQASTYMMNVEQRVESGEVSGDRLDLELAVESNLYQVSALALTIPVFTCQKEREANPDAIVQETSQAGWRIPWGVIDAGREPVYRLPRPEAEALWAKRVEELRELEKGKPSLYLVE